MTRSSLVLTLVAAATCGCLRGTDETSGAAEAAGALGPNPTVKRIGVWLADQIRATASDASESRRSGKETFAYRKKVELDVQAFETCVLTWKRTETETTKRGPSAERALVTLFHEEVHLGTLDHETLAPLSIPSSAGAASFVSARPRPGERGTRTKCVVLTPEGEEKGCQVSAPAGLRLRLASQGVVEQAIGRLRDAVADCNGEEMAQ